MISAAARCLSSAGLRGEPALTLRDGLRVPPTITRFDPYGGPPQQVDVRRALGRRAQ